VLPPAPILHTCHKTLKTPGAQLFPIFSSNTRNQSYSQSRSLELKQDLWCCPPSPIPPAITRQEKLTCSSNRRQPTVFDNLCAFFINSVCPLPVSGIFITLRHPKTRCAIVPYHPALLRTSRSTSSTPYQHSAPEAPSSNPRWLLVSTRPAPEVSPPTPSIRHWRPR
jgi:hypothetical protein